MAARTKGAKATGASTAGGDEVRVRMYRVGFGDFFLLTVPGTSGPAHILIDCGVHAGNIGSMDDCVKDLAKETGQKLALVILTHYHADHMSGFASNAEDFAKFEVGAVWMTNRLDPDHEQHAGFMAKMVSLANAMREPLAARDDESGRQAAAKVHNALGVAGGGNAKALELLQEGFSNKPPVYYYQGGDEPTLPAELQDTVAAQILAPSPNDSGGVYAASDDKAEQYLAAVSDRGIATHRTSPPFEKRWPASSSDYPRQPFEEFASDGDIRSWRKRLEERVRNLRPDELAVAADKLDGTLNNQSLVVLFTVAGKKLLFVGDAQWGNWSYWLYGKAVSGSEPGIQPSAKEILGSIDFYKVGHHGSTNATPIPVVGALAEGCSSMCSTAAGAYGNPDKHTEVPRTALLDALEKKTGNRLVRSDWVPAGDAKADPDAVAATPELPSGFTTPGALYIDLVI